jgi:hypothetical protein
MQLTDIFSAVMVAGRKLFPAYLCRCDGRMLSSRYSAWCICTATAYPAWVAVFALKNVPNNTVDDYDKKTGHDYRA